MKAAKAKKEAKEKPEAKIQEVTEEEAEKIKKEEAKRKEKEQKETEDKKAESNKSDENGEVSSLIKTDFLNMKTRLKNYMCCSLDAHFVPREREREGFHL